MKAHGERKRRGLGGLEALPHRGLGAEPLVRESGSQGRGRGEAQRRLDEGQNLKVFHFSA